MALVSLSASMDTFAPFVIPQPAGPPPPPVSPEESEDEHEPSSQRAQTSRHGRKTHQIHLQPLSVDKEAREEISRLRDAFVEQSKYTASLREELDELRRSLVARNVAINDVHDENEDVLYEPKPQTIYSHSVERLLMHRTGPLSTLNTVIRVGVLTTSQLILTFAFADASELLARLGSEPGVNAFLPPMSTVNFYVGKTTRDDAGDMVPTINVLASGVAMFLLTLVLSSDALETLLTPHPIVGVIMSHDRSQTVQRHLSPIDVVLAMFLHIIWAVRAIFMPAMAAVGTAMAMASANDSVEIVLNSVAIGFVFELDNVMYPILITSNDRNAYEASAPAAGTPLAVGGSPTVAGRYGSLLTLFQLTTMTFIYAARSFPAILKRVEYSADTYWQLLNLFMAQSTVFVLAIAHLQLRGSMRIRSSTVMARDVLLWTAGLLLIAAVFVASGIFIFILYQFLVHYLGYLATSCADAGSQFAICLGNLVPTEECALADGYLSRVAPGSNYTVVIADYSYEDTFRTMKRWGISMPGCYPPSAKEADSTGDSFSMAYYDEQSA